MATSDVQFVKVQDDLLDVSDKIRYAVQKGPSQYTLNTYKAISQTPSSHVYNVVVPSENTVINRRILWKSTCVLKVDCAGVPPGSFPCDYGLTDALGPMPLHSLCTTIQSTINNSTVSTNINDLLAPLLQIHDSRQLAAYNSTTPTMPDNYRIYADGVLGVNNPLGGYVNAQDEDLVPRGSFSDVIIGSVWVPGTAPTGALSNAGGAQTFYIQFTVTEPIFGLSPWTWVKSGSNNQGIYGISNLTFQMNMNPLNNRVFRSANNYSQAVAVQEFRDSELVLGYATLQPSQLVSSKNVVPYLEFPRFLTPFNSPVAAGTTAVIPSQSIQLQQIPDSILIFARRQLGQLTPSTPDYFLPIERVSINFNNQSGILASATQATLYNMSKKNGLRANWATFRGGANKNDSTTGVGDFVPLCGAPLWLNFYSDIAMNQDYWSPGSIGAFNLQIDVTVRNQNVGGPAENNIELVIVPINSGVFVSERGQSAIYTGILSRQDVLDASSKEGYTRSDVVRMVGGGLLDSIRSVMGKVAPIAQKLMTPEMAKCAEKVMSAVKGEGRSGGMTRRLM